MTSVNCWLVNWTTERILLILQATQYFVISVIEPVRTYCVQSMAELNALDYAGQKMHCIIEDTTPQK